MGRQFIGNLRMNFFSVAIISLIVLSGCLFAEEEEKTAATPNPALTGFPTHWSATSWDTAKGATFWNAPSPSKAASKPAKEPISQTPQPNDFFDRQSEK